MWLRVNNIQGKITRWLLIIKHKQSARIMCKNNLFKPCVRSKQPRTIKTIICTDIFTSLRRKKVQSPAKQFKELFSLCPNHFRWNGIVVSRFNHVCFWFRRWIARAIGSPSSSCEMILLRNNSHGGIIRICMGIFTTTLRNKKIRQIFNKNTSPYSTVYRLLTWWKEPILASCSFRGFQRTWEKPFFPFPFFQE